MIRCPKCKVEMAWEQDGLSPTFFNCRRCGREYRCRLELTFEPSSYVPPPAGTKALLPVRYETLEKTAELLFGPKMLAAVVEMQKITQRIIDKAVADLRLPSAFCPSLYAHNGKVFSYPGGPQVGADTPPVVKFLQWPDVATFTPEADTPTVVPGRESD